MDRVRLDEDSSLLWRDHAESGSFLSDEQRATFDADGFCIVKGAMRRHTLRQVEHEIDRLERDRNDWLRDQPWRRSWISEADVVDFAPSLVAKSPLLRQFSVGHPMIDVCRELVGPDVRLYFDQAVYKRPDTSNRTLPLHQDNGYNFKRPEAYITIWIPFQDVTPANGCLRVVPGIHRIGTLHHHFTKDGFLTCDIAPNEAVAVPVRAGDLVVLSSLAPHATAGNSSRQVRKAYLLSYVADGTRLRDGTTCDAPETQYQVLRSGRALGASPDTWLETTL
jgi:ectoine hydroxylase-related dioxygenase (phytanoyl-CoA dioxygenase family)